MKLEELSYYQTGGPCNKICFPKKIESLKRVLKAVEGAKTPYFYLGAGSNSLIMDEPYQGVVIAFGKMNAIRLEPEGLYVEAGVENTVVAEFCRDHGLGDLTFLYRLPGQIGATVRMNARCYGSEMSEVVAKIISVTPEGKVSEHGGQGAFLGYKNTIFKSNGEAIAAVYLRVKPTDPVPLTLKMQRYEADRTRRQQFLFPSCGCVFKNDYSVGIPSGWLLDQAGVGELSTDKVLINPNHANFVFNKGARGSAILRTTFKMREAVYQKFGVWLQYEMEVLGSILAEFETQLLMEKPYRPTKELAALRREYQNRNQPGSLPRIP